MSDHDFSDAEELDVDGFDSPAPNADNSNSNDPKRHARVQHNLLERRRRDNIKDMYTSLKEEIPNFNSDRASRAQILKKTIELIQEQSADANQLGEEVKQLEEKNAKMREELQKRKEDRGSGGGGGGGSTQPTTSS